MFIINNQHPLSLDNIRINITWLTTFQRHVRALFNPIYDFKMYKICKEIKNEKEFESLANILF